MRIIAGRFKGRKLFAPPGLKTRPTSDRVRESLFMILGNLEQASVWDVFAGTGALGLEALSRGAAHVLFSDTSKQAIRVLKQHIQNLDLEQQTTLVMQPYQRAITKITTPPDVVFVDPPYNANLYTPCLSLLSQHPAIPHQALIVVEHRPAYHLNPKDFNLSHDETRHYGNTSISLFYKP